MPREKKASHRPTKAQPIVAAVVQPVAKRLARIEDLLIEVRYEQDVKHKKIAALQAQLEALTEEVRAGTMKRPISK